MGVPAFFRWLTTRYPKVCKQFPEDGSPGPDCDNLYFDLNGVIHPCTQEEKGNTDEANKRRFQRIFESCDRIVELLKPRNLIYFAIDGVAPRAKMNQQRTRRFSKILEKKEEDDDFDSNTITPGTKFMQKLQTKFESYLANRIKEKWTVDVIFSSSQDAGEGEHKILDFIRKQPEQVSHVVYGGDADLIMLGLTTREKNLFVLREDPWTTYESSFKTPEFSYKLAEIEKHGEWRHLWIVSMESIRDYLKLEFETLEGDFMRRVDDFIFLCIFVGNDFLPRLPSLSIHDGGLDILLSIYKRLVEKDRIDFLVDQDKPILRNVDIFFEYFARAEKQILKMIQRNRVKAKNYRYRQNERIAAEAAKLAKEKGEEKEAEEEEEEEEEKCQLENEEIEWITQDCKKNFYKRKFALEDSDVYSFLAGIRHSYCEGLFWILAYYFKGCPSWSWYYPYHYAPLASDLLGISVLESTEFFTKDKPLLAFEQLMCVLPVESCAAAGVPPKITKAMRLKMADCFPCKFNSDLNGSLHQWQAIVRLPFLCQNRLHEISARFLRDKNSKDYILDQKKYKRLNATLKPMYLKRKGSTSTCVKLSKKRKLDKINAFDFKFRIKKKRKTSKKVKKVVFFEKVQSDDISDQCRLRGFFGSPAIHLVNSVMSNAFRLEDF